MIYQWKLYKGRPRVPWHVTNLSANCCSNRLAWPGPKPCKSVSLLRYPSRKRCPEISMAETYLSKRGETYHQVFASHSLLWTRLYLQAPVQPLRTCDTLSEGPVIWIVALSFASLTCQRLRYSNRQAPWLLKVQRPSLKNLVVLLTQSIRFPKLFLFKSKVSNTLESERDDMQR